MVSVTQTVPVSNKMLWAGRIVSALPVLMFLMSGVMKFTNSPQLAESFNHLGLDTKLAFGLGILELTCTILYAIPRTAVLGAILLTGYVGGAILTHLRVGDPIYTQIILVVLGVLVWGGLYFRDARGAH